MQIGDGSAGPKIQSVSLSAGNSIFSGNVASESDLGGTSWTVYYALEANIPVSLAASSPATLMAQVTFDTTGILSAGILARVSKRYSDSRNAFFVGVRPRSRPFTRG